MNQRDLFEINQNQIDPTLPTDTNNQNEIVYRRPLFIKNSFNFVDDNGTQFIGGPQRRSGMKLALWTWFALLTDTLVILSMGCLFNLIAMLTIQYLFKSDLGFIFNKSNRYMTMLSVFVFTGWMYFIATRALVGASVGEWSCALRLGQPTERLKENYISKLILRTTVSLMTGIITLPIISLILRKDVSGVISGLHVYSLK